MHVVGSPDQPAAAFRRHTPDARVATAATLDRAITEVRPMSAAIVLIHGRGPKPRKQTLLDCWRGFLPEGARPLPVEMAHWVDLFKYTPRVLPDDQADCDHLAGADLPDSVAQAFGMAASSQESVAAETELAGRALSWRQIRDGLLEASWRAFTRISGNQFAVDAQNFFTDDPVLRTESRRRLRDAVQIQRAAGHEVLVIAHSFGAIVAYELARELQHREIHTLITLGSPLAWCYDMWAPAKPPPTPDYFNAKEFPRRGLRHWWNVYDPADPVSTAQIVAVAPAIAPEYRSGGAPLIVDAPVSNSYSREGDPGSAHDYRGYLQSMAVQRAIALFMLEVA